MRTLALLCGLLAVSCGDEKPAAVPGPSGAPATLTAPAPAGTPAPPAKDGC